MDIFSTAKRDLLIFACVFAAVLAGLFYAPDWVIMVGAGVSGILFLVFLADFIALRYVRYRRDLLQFETATPQVRLLEAISRMGVEQLAAINGQLPVLEIMAGNVGLIKYLAYGEERIPLAWVRQFMSLGNGDYFYPRRRFDKDTNHRKWADMVTNLMVYLGFAEPADGPYAARWINKPGGLKAVGLIDSDAQAAQFGTNRFVHWKEDEPEEDQP